MLLGALSVTGACDINLTEEKEPHDGTSEFGDYELVSVDEWSVPVVYILDSGDSMGFVSGRFELHEDSSYRDQRISYITNAGGRDTTIYDYVGTYSREGNDLWLSGRGPLGGPADYADGVIVLEGAWVNDNSLDFRYERIEAE